MRLINCKNLFCVYKKKKNEVHFKSDVETRIQKCCIIGIKNVLIFVSETYRSN